MAKASVDEVDFPFVKVIFGGLAAILLVIVMFGSLYMVQSGEEAIVLTWGKANPASIGPGLHTKWPIAQQVVKFDVRTKNYGADASGSSYESASSKDLQIVQVAVAVNYHVDGASIPEVYQNVGLNYEDKVITPTVHESVKAVTADYTAEELITKREEVRAKIQDLLMQKLEQYHIVVEQVSITKFDFSKEFNEAIEQKVTAEQNALTEQNKLKIIQFQAQQQVAQANGARDAAIAQAEGQANATILTGQAEAEKIHLQNQELSKSPQYVELIKWQRWNGQLPTWYMSGSGSNAVPLINIPSPSGSNSSN